MIKKDMNVLFSNTIFLYLMQISGYIFPLLTFPYLTRVLGPEKYGIVVFGNATMVYFQLLIDFGFLLSATKECSLNRDNKGKLVEILSSVIQAKFILVVVGFAILAYLVLNVSTFQDKKVFLLLSYIPIMISILIPDYLFRGLEQMSTIAYRTIIPKALSTIMIFIIISTPEDYIYIPILNAIGNLVVVALTWYILVRKMGINYKLISMKITFKALKTSSVFFLSRIATSIYGASNTFLLGFYQSNFNLAQFGAATTLNSSLRGLFSPIADSLYPYMVKQKNYQLVRTVLLIATPLITMGSIILYIYAEPIIILICGKEYSEAVSIFRVLIPILIFTLPIYLLGYPVLGAMNKMKEANLSIVYPAIFHLIGLGVLFTLDMLSLIFVAVLTCLTELLVLLLRVFYVFKGFKALKKS